MIDPIINTIVIAIFGFFIGIILILSRPVLERTRDPISFKFSLQVFVVLGAFYGLIAVLVLTLIYSPIEMAWWPFLGAVLLGYLFMLVIFTLARRGEIRVTKRTVLDVLRTRRRVD